MNMDEYGYEVEKLILTNGKTYVDKRLMENTLGLVGEAGEFAEKIKKQIGPPPADHVCDCCGKTEQAILEEFRLHQGTKKKTVWTYDHDFKTGKFKGIICQPCNSVVGNLQDDIILADKVVKYIQKNYE